MTVIILFLKLSQKNHVFVCLFIFILGRRAICSQTLPNFRNFNGIYDFSNFPTVCTRVICFLWLVIMKKALPEIWHLLPFPLKFISDCKPFSSKVYLLFCWKFLSTTIIYYFVENLLFLERHWVAVMWKASNSRNKTKKIMEINSN